jgi:hypothetical protein
MHRGFASLLGGALLYPLLLLPGCAQAELPPVYGSEPIETSLVRVLADPGQFEGKLVRAIGFCSVEFEGNALYMHREDYEQGISKNGVWLSLGDARAPERVALAKKVHRKYCLVEGRVTAREHGHLGMFSGAIGDITRLDFWSSGEPNERSRQPLPPPRPSSAP